MMALWHEVAMMMTAMMMSIAVAMMMVIMFTLRSTMQSMIMFANGSVGYVSKALRVVCEQPVGLALASCEINGALCDVSSRSAPLILYMHLFTQRTAQSITRKAVQFYEWPRNK